MRTQCYSVFSLLLVFTILCLLNVAQGSCKLCQFTPWCWWSVHTVCSWSFGWKRLLAWAKNSKRTSIKIHWLVFRKRTTHLWMCAAPKERGIFSQGTVFWFFLRFLCSSVISAGYHSSISHVTQAAPSYFILETVENFFNREWKKKKESTEIGSVLIFHLDLFCCLLCCCPTFPTSPTSSSLCFALLHWETWHIIPTAGFTVPCRHPRVCVHNIRGEIIIG